MSYNELKIIVFNLQGGEKNMEKVIKFIDSDKDLIDKIKEYQIAHGLSSFVATVRKLCSDALEIEKIRH